MEQRRAIRRFLSNPVADDVVRSILTSASRAPSGTNIQPWFVHVVTGEARKRLCRAAGQAMEAGQESLEYEYLPNPIGDPYMSRRRSLGYALYSLYGIERTDYLARKQAMLRNFDFFGAPVGLFFTMERQMALGNWLDMGMFMQNVMLAARAHGLETCPQQAWCDCGVVVHLELRIPDEQILLCGMSLGYADPEAPENRLISERVPMEEFTTFHDE